MKRKNKSLILADLDAVIARDPATSSRFAAALLSSGFHAITAYRFNHLLWQKNFKLTARFLSQVTRFLTGVEIHPAAKIGTGFFIDHGMGVVIGETAEIGDNCTIYQGVTLGGTGKDIGKRHPTLGDNVMVGAGAKILGPVTVGSGSKVAANAVVLHAVPENSTAVGIPAKVVRRCGEKVNNDMDQIHIPDPVAQKLCRLEHEVERLKAMLGKSED